jgi:nucleotide-binding universal stress UspA family protein
MPGLEKLLLSTDGSEYSEGAVREAINLAKICKSKLYVVAVIETNPEFETLALDIVEKAEIQTKEYLDALKVRTSREGIDSEFIVHEGESPHIYIVEEANQKQTAMIIMGRRGRTGLKRLMMGSVTARVIGDAPCHVLVVPRAAQVSFKNILIATDGSAYSDYAASQALGIAKCYGSSVTVVSVARSESEVTAAKAHVNKVTLLAQKEEIQTEGITPLGKAYETIVEIANSKCADVIAMSTHGKTGIKRLLMGSVTERVIGLASCAVLVVKA